jgi:hypothetical protein
VFRVVFTPAISPAPNQAGDISSYHQYINTVFNDTWPYLKFDAIIVPTANSGSGHGQNSVATIGYGLLGSTSRIAHELGHIIGLEHLTGPCGVHCDDAPTFMCIGGVGSIEFADCDITRLPTDVLRRNKF